MPSARHWHSVGSASASGFSWTVQFYGHGTGTSHHGSAQAQTLLYFKFVYHGSSGFKFSFIIIVRGMDHMFSLGSSAAAVGLRVGLQFSKFSRV